MGTFEDLTGRRFGRLTVVKRVPNLPGSRLTRWECKCDCGNITHTSRANLLHGHSTSCGCYARELITGNTYRETHNQSYTRLYHIWQSMKQRCYDKNDNAYKWYGRRGITVCNEWMEYENFQKWAVTNGYKNNLTIDRINVNGNYESTNCRWATTKEQNRNKTNNRIIKCKGEKHCMGYWSEKLNIPMNTILNRLNRGCTPEEALNTNYKRRCKEIGIETIPPGELQSMKDSWGV
jgi:hypothetical protein